LQEKVNHDARIDVERQAHPEMAEVLANAKSLFDKKEFQLAQNLYRTVLKANPKNELAVRGAAECAKAFHKHEEALVLLKNLVEHNKSSDNYRLLGDQLYAMAYLEDAVEAYMRALQDFEMEPQSLFNIFKNMGNIFLRLGDADGAEEFYNKAYTIDPDSDTLFVNYGSLYVYRGDYNKALTRFREAIQLNVQK
jgi:tetratricopeptide (TPR) repeat protein